MKILKPKYKLALLSNSLQSHTRINKKRGLFKNFDLAMLSHEVELTKDTKDVFLLTAKKLNAKPKDCIFIDDVEEFVKVAESAGLKGILFKNPEQLESDLEKILKHKII